LAQAFEFQRSLWAHSCCFGLGMTASTPTPSHAYHGKVAQDEGQRNFLTNGQVYLESEKGPRLVSLGCACSVKGSFQELKRSRESLPLDWVRTRMQGVVHYLQNEFADFMNFTAQEPVMGNPHQILYRDQYHSFWHDDPNDVPTQEKYRRRIKRFLALDAESESLLFVHAVNHTDELCYVDELLQGLVARFGRASRLLLIIDQQKTREGPALVQDRDNLLVYFVLDQENASPSAPYCIPIEYAVDWVEGRLTGLANTQVFPDIGSLAGYADPHPQISPLSFKFFEDMPLPGAVRCEPGPEGLDQHQLWPQRLDGVVAARMLNGDQIRGSSAEPMDSGTNLRMGQSVQPSNKYVPDQMSLSAWTAAQERRLKQASAGLLGQTWPATLNAWKARQLVQDWQADKQPLPDGKEGFKLVCLGSDCGVKASFLELKRHSEPVPFDFIRIRMQGLVHYLQTGFNDFLSFSSQEVLPEHPGSVLYQDCNHSFLDENPYDSLTREKYQARIDHFDGLRAGSDPLLFVYSVSDHDELRFTRPLIQELVAQFGQKAHLLLIIDYQQTVQGPAVITDCRNILVYFVPDANMHSASLAPYCVPIECGIDWLEGRQISAWTLPSVDMIKGYADPYPQWK